MTTRRALLAGLLAFAGGRAEAHSARSGMACDPWCCNAQDCAEIPGHAVTEVRGGWRITLKRGEHPMVKSASVSHFVALGDARPSDDGRFHACLYPDENTMRCFYAPPGGF
jgi:hypothetical protein